MRIALIGFMGCGKSTVGELLAKELGYEFIDTDAEIEKKLGLTIPEIFEKYGESFFREKERETLIDLLEKDNTVISTGGGLPAYKDNMEILNAKTTTVYLKAPFPILWNRIKHDNNRPLVLKGKEGLYNLFTEREKFYNKACYTITIGSEKPQTIMSKIKNIIINGEPYGQV